MQKVLVEETLPIAKELYAGLVLDRAIGKVVFMASSEGGMDIEEVAAHTPEKILKEIDRARASALRRFRRASWRSASAFPEPAVNCGGVVHDGAGQSK